MPQKLHKTVYLDYKILLLVALIVYSLAILQDYIFSQIRLTGFYWSDTMLYNIYWLLFIPFIYVSKLAYNKFQPKNHLQKIIYACSSAGICWLLHVFIFTSIFILGSSLIFPVPHRFSTILKHAVSNQLHITVLLYAFVPVVFEYVKNKKQPQSQPTITVKHGTRRIKIDTANILLLKADKPYTMIYTNEQKLLHDESLKKLENILDTQTFFRVHRSFIINKNYISELKSRKNGDYDGVLTNGETIRLSRHYRKNWISLLNH